jgi:serine/threonine protein kinase
MQPALDQDLTGRTVDHYVIVALIAAGGQGCVYRGRDTRLYRDVAIKVRRITKALSPLDLIAEARTLSLVSHPHVARIYDFVMKHKRGFLVMEFVPGATLRDVLAGGPLPAAEVVRLGADIARGLAAAHAASVVHGDVKPSNLKITSSGEVKILDFGVAKILPAAVLADDATRTPTTSSVAGTVPYMAPEQLRGDEADPRSDIFSLGAVLYEMATGRRAFAQRDLGHLVEAVQHDQPQRPTAVNPLVPLALERVVARALQKNVAARQQSAIELAEALESLMPHVRRETASTAADPRVPAQAVERRVLSSTVSVARRPVPGPTPQRLSHTFPARGCALR